MRTLLFYGILVLQSVLFGVAFGDEGTKFDYDCADRPFLHPYYGRAGVIGDCTATIPAPDGPKTVHASAKNTQWALWLVANEICRGKNEEIFGLDYRCAWIAVRSKPGN